MTPAEDRANHPDGEAFGDWFMDMLLENTHSCFERDVLRDNMNNLWESWKKRGKEYDSNSGALNVGSKI
jgi:hypothetical protein